MKVRRFGTLALETFKTLNDLNPAFMKNLFAKREVSKRRKKPRIGIKEFMLENFFYHFKLATLLKCAMT